jgi:hypothetical protein
MTALNITGDYFTKIIEDNHLGKDDTDSIKNTVTKLLDTETNINSPGMLLGKIQSGKTRNYIGIIALALDNGFDGAIILTKGTRALSKQTLQRVSKEFQSFTDNEMLLAFDVMTSSSNLTGYEMNKKLIFISKKQSDNMIRLIELFSKNELISKRILIIDDEADYASVGYKKTKDDPLDVNTTTKQIDDLRKLLKNSSFLQVTATPYSLYLQPENIEIKGIEFKPIKPAFTELVPVSEDYIGGDFYFIDSQDENNVASYLYIPISQSELEVLSHEDRRKFKLEDTLRSEAISSLRLAMVSFIVGGCIRRIQQLKEGSRLTKFSFIMHTEQRKDAHQWQATVVSSLLDSLINAVKNDFTVCHDLIKEAYEDLIQSVSITKLYIPSVTEVKEEFSKYLTQGFVRIDIVNSEKEIEELLDDQGQLKLRTPLHIFIGGQILDRGVTIANLIGFYYGRNPKRFQQDTVLQHSRMYGFRTKDDLTVTRFYTAPHIYEIMKQMHEFDSSLRSSVESGTDKSVIFIRTDDNNVIRPCNPNKIKLSNVKSLKPFKRILPVGFQTEKLAVLRPITNYLDKKIDQLKKSIPAENAFLITYDEAEDIINKIKESIIMEEEEGYLFNWEETLTILKFLSNIDKVNQGVWCLVRTDRNISRMVTKGHAKYSDAPDTASTDGALARKTAINNPMLILLKQNGKEESGWRGAPFYWPVIFVQENTKTVIFSSEADE